MPEKENLVSIDSFLYKRNDFAKSIGVPDLYEHIDQFSLFAGMHTIGNKLWTYDLLKKQLVFLGIYLNLVAGKVLT